MRQLAKHFLKRPSAERVIRDWQQQLSTFKSRPAGSSTKWTIPKNDPIQTIVSQGEYERSGKHGKAVFGSVSGVWDIQIPQVTGKKGSTQKSFVLHGLASTEITIWAYQENREEPEEMARWTIEVGDGESPGCHFHTQVKHHNPDRKPFPVPRLPTLLHTPMDALEFLLAELFQDRWYEHTSKASDALLHWAHCQKHRFTELLKWQLLKIEETSGSPWTTFKRQKPAPDLFVKARR